MKTKTQWAYIQHPMWLVIREDAVCAESTPPWGAKNLNDYSERIHRNLKSMEDNPELCLNYEFGAYELEDLTTKFPNLYRRMKVLVKK